MVMENPIQVTRVIAVPFCSGGAETATRAENWGESETTVIPQSTIRDKKKKIWALKKNGTSMQQHPDKRRE